MCLQGILDCTLDCTLEFYPKSTLVSVSNELSMVAFHVVLVYIAYIFHIQNFAAGELSM